MTCAAGANAPRPARSFMTITSHSRFQVVLASAISGGDQAYHDNHLAGMAYIQILAFGPASDPSGRLSQAGRRGYIRWSSGSGFILRHRKRRHITQPG